jgi:hypothetical protein
MKHLLTRELEPTAKPEDRRFKTLQMTWDRIVAATTDNPSLIAVMLFCAIGLSITLNLILRFPDAGLLVEQHDVFPFQEAAHTLSP